jgi:hypothetical protein
VKNKTSEWLLLREEGGSAHLQFLIDQKPHAEVTLLCHETVSNTCLHSDSQCAAITGKVRLHRSCPGSLLRNETFRKYEYNQYNTTGKHNTNHQIFLAWSKEDDRDRPGHVARMGERRGAYRALVRKP